MSDFDTIYMRSSSGGGGKQVCVPSLLFRHRHRKGRKEFCILVFFFIFHWLLSEKSPKCPAAQRRQTNDRPHELVEIHQNQSLSLLALNGARHGKAAGC